MEAIDLSKLPEVSEPILKILQEVKCDSGERNDHDMHDYYSDEPRHDYYSDNRT